MSAGSRDGAAPLSGLGESLFTRGGVRLDRGVEFSVAALNEDCSLSLGRVSISKLIAPIVVIPVHKLHPTPDETVSIRQCAKVFRDKKIAFLAPERLSLQTYFSLIPCASEFRVSGKWMDSIDSYNRLMISMEFYKLLNNYTHLLIHEPDAIVVRDELDSWCVQEIDFIGAPWFEGLTRAKYKYDAYPIGVGNFGLSLIRLAAAQDVLKSTNRWYTFHKIPRDFLKGVLGSRSALRRSLLGLGVGGELRNACHLYGGNCDIFWCCTVPENFKEFRVASIEQALKFSWEVLPRRCAELTNGALPFGFHAWAKYDRAFLTSLLESIGVEFN